MQFSDKTEFYTHYAGYLTSRQKEAFKRAVEEMDEDSALCADVVCRYDAARAFGAIKAGIKNDVIGDCFITAYRLVKAVEGVICTVGLCKEELLACFEYLKKKRYVFEITPKTTTVIKLCFARAYYDSLRFIASQLGFDEDFSEFRRIRDELGKDVENCFNGEFYLDTGCVRSIPSPYASLIPLAQMLADPQRADGIVARLDCIIQAVSHERWGAFVLIPSTEGLITYEYDNCAEIVKETACRQYIEGELSYDVSAAECAAIIARLALIG